MYGGDEGGCFAENGACFEDEEVRFCLPMPRALGPDTRGACRLRPRLPKGAFSCVSGTRRCVLRRMVCVFEDEEVRFRVFCGRLASAARVALRAL